MSGDTLNVDTCHVSRVMTEFYLLHVDTCCLNLRYFEVFTKGNNAVSDIAKHGDREDPFNSPLVM